jgi:hypothetical protein
MNIMRMVTKKIRILEMGLVHTLRFTRFLEDKVRFW